MASSGVDFIIQIAEDVQTVTASGGVTADTFTLTLQDNAGNAETTAAIAYNATAAAVQTALEALTLIGTGNVTVAGSAGGPWTVTFGGALLGDVMPLFTGVGTNALVITVARSAAVSYTTVAAQRDAKMNRTTTEADATAKDTAAGWHAGLPILREWTITADILIIEADNGQIALESCYLNNRQVHVRCQTPAGKTYTGDGTLTEFSVNAPHDNVLTGACTVKGTLALTKA